MCQSHRNRRDFEGFFIQCTRSNDYPILKVFLFNALDQMTIHGAVVMDFLFIQPFGWIRIIIACGKKSQKNQSDLNL
jgi:hypothetical protein